MTGFNKLHYTFRFNFWPRKLTETMQSPESKKPRGQESKSKRNSDYRKKLIESDPNFREKERVRQQIYRLKLTDDRDQMS